MGLLWLGLKPDGNRWEFALGHMLVDVSEHVRMGLLLGKGNKRELDACLVADVLTDLDEVDQLSITVDVAVDVHEL